MNAIERTLELEASPERVWRALTDEKELAAWFPDQAELEPRAGGQGRFSWEGHGSCLVGVEEFEPPKRLVWRWAHDIDKPLAESPSTLVEWTLTPRQEGGTTLFMRETGFASPKERQENVSGWKHELAELLTFLGEPERVAA